MRQNLPNYLAFVVLTAAALTGLYFGDRYLFPPKPPQPEQPAPPPGSRETTAALAGTAVLGAEPFDRLRPLPPLALKPAELKPGEPAKPAPPPKPSEPPALIALGGEGFYLNAVLTSRGAGVQQLVLTRFEEANRLGRPAIDPDTGKARPLHLIPGYVRPHFLAVTPQPEYKGVVPNFTVADLAAGRKPGPVANADWLSRPSYALYHYPATDDPARPPKETPEPGKPPRPDADHYPLPDLGDREWKVTAIKPATDAGPAEVAFETELGSPYFLRLRKTFTLAKTDYDFKLRVDVEPLPGRRKEAGRFRYQIAGPVGMPVEGEWYTSTYRNVYSGWLDGYGTARRQIDDPAGIHFKEGGDPVASPGRFLYAATGTQYFASALAVDGDADPWEYVRPTREETPHDFARVNGLLPDLALKGDIQTRYDPDRAFLYDVSFRAVSKVLDPGPGETVSHGYAVYNGPIKVRLLRQMYEPDRVTRSVADETVDRYLDKYHLDTLTDYHSPNWFGRFANFIWWTDVLIFSTNIMHWLLGTLHGWVGSWGVSIMLLTVIVRMCLFGFSRRQQAINAHMAARLKRIKPELDKISEKYRDDFLTQQAERSKLMRKAGISQSAQMGGCLLIFLQMPVFMGLYFCLQESVFFRLEPFLWITNLAAPDMLLYWGEHIPLISSPWNRVGGWSFLYLGPYFNVLPLAAVVLFWVQQKLTMPPPTNEMEEQQRQMMKFMLVFTGLFFYKVAAGLCLYFIVSGLWSLAERRLVPKPDLSKAEAIAAGGPDAEAKGADEPAKPQGWLARKATAMRERMEELQRQAEAQRQFRNDPPAGGGKDAPPRPSAGDRADRRKKKKRK